MKRCATVRKTRDFLWGEPAVQLHISRASYYQWRSGTAGGRVAENQRIAQLVQEIHRESPDKGYRRIRDDLDKYYHTPVNDKRTLRICRGLGIRSVVKHAPQGCTSGGVLSAAAGGESSEPPVLRRPPQREVAHRCDGVPLLCGSPSCASST